MLRLAELHPHPQRRPAAGDLQVPVEAAPALDGMVSLAELAAPGWRDDRCQPVSVRGLRTGLAERGGVNVLTLRYYERRGLPTQAVGSSRS
jgi:hypothetical protein